MANVADHARDFIRQVGCHDAAFRRGEIRVDGGGQMVVQRVLMPPGGGDLGYTHANGQAFPGGGGAGAIVGAWREVHRVANPVPPPAEPGMLVWRLGAEVCIKRFPLRDAGAIDAHHGHRMGENPLAEIKALADMHDAPNVVRMFNILMDLADPAAHDPPRPARQEHFRIAHMKLSPAWILIVSPSS